MDGVGGDDLQTEQVHLAPQLFDREAGELPPVPADDRAQPGEEEPHEVVGQVRMARRLGLLDKGPEEVVLELELLRIPFVEEAEDRLRAGER